MAGEWVAAPLGDLVEDILDRRGVTPLKLGSDFVSAGHRVISAKLVKSGRIDLGADEPRFVNDTTYQKWMRTPLLADDVLLTSEAPLGGVAYVGAASDWVLGQRLFAIRTDKRRLHGRFLFYALQCEPMRHGLQSRATGTTAQGIRQSELRRVMVPLPPLAEQQRIADILGTLDDKIELNRRMSDTLEAITRTLFKSWFVDFDPVRAKSEGRDPGLPEGIAILFAGGFVDAKLGAIPAGWDVRTLGDLLELAYGKALVAQNRASGSIPVFGSNGQVGWHDEQLSNGPGIIVGRKGNPGVVTWAPTGFFAIDTTFYVVPRAEYLSLYFLFYALQEQNLSSLGADSAVPGLNRNVAYMSSQIVPPALLLQAFDSVVRPLFERIHAANEEARTLDILRDTLLPKLISGELRVRDANRIAAGGGV